MRVADFFCGGGGFSEGFRQAGFQIVFAVDKWAPAVTTYKGNKPGVNVVQDDVIRISNLPDDEFEMLVPDSEVIIGSPPCQAFSHSNKSGNGDKTLGIQLIEAYLRIIARKKAKPGSVLKYWVLENVPAVRNYIKDVYTAEDLGITGDVVLYPHKGAAGIYNAKYFGAPTNRERYLCGEFPAPAQTHTDQTVVPLKDVLRSLGDPLSTPTQLVKDVNYPDLILPRSAITDHAYINELAPFEWQTAKRLKQDKGYMGKMSFPENIEKPSRTVMATMSASSREAMILGYQEGRYRLPTVREVACMMSFPNDYRFYGCSKAMKYMLVGNAVPPKLSNAIAKAILTDSNEHIPNHYIPIHHDESIDFFNLNGKTIPLNVEKTKKATAKFKYHIPYLIYSAYRVELTNYHSDFASSNYKWNVEIHHSQGKEKAEVFCPSIGLNMIDSRFHERISQFIVCHENLAKSYEDFQVSFCMTSNQRNQEARVGPYEFLSEVREFIDELMYKDDQALNVFTHDVPETLPQAIVIGYYTIQQILIKMGGLEA